ncbi:hypothetical protein K469DRAFT_755263 [Zopfia rhizophila CBS 207.26]|uniref:Uncharacterized protein n=1 Tax=Zopfia rhizophila CBS 207.26 TaxID=1314779 RepID=A0A6A6DCQ4_9PEZI|nr:hypothetical protein K469DRAFT_755263 [Zopfia rhizophila CBS 207.26]
MDTARPSSGAQHSSENRSGNTDSETVTVRPMKRLKNEARVDQKKELSFEISPLTVPLEQISSQLGISESNSAINRHSLRLDDQYGRLNCHDSQLHGLDNRVKAVENKVKKPCKDHSTLQQRFEQVCEGEKGLIVKVNRQDGRITSIEGEATQNSATLKGLQTESAQHSASIGTLQTSFKGLDSRIVRIENGSADNSETLKSHHSRMDLHLCQIATLENRVDDLDSRVKRIDTEIQPGAFASARRDINTNKTCCEQLDKVAKRQYSEIKEVKSDLSLKADKSDYKKLRDEVEKDANSNQTEIQELKQMIQNQEKLIRSLQEFCQNQANLVASLQREVIQCQANAQATEDELNLRSDGLDKKLDVFNKKLSQAQEMEKKHYADQNQVLQTRIEQVEGRHGRLATDLATHTTQIRALKLEYQSFERKVTDEIKANIVDGLRGDLKHNQETIKLRQGTLETAFTNHCGRLEGLTSRFDKFETSLQSKMSEVKREAQESVSQRVNIAMRAHRQVSDMQKLEEKFDKRKPQWKQRSMESTEPSQISRH